MKCRNDNLKRVCRVVNCDACLNQLATSLSHGIRQRMAQDFTSESLLYKKVLKMKSRLCNGNLPHTINTGIFHKRISQAYFTSNFHKHKFTHGYKTFINKDIENVSKHIMDIYNR